MRAAEVIDQPAEVEVHATGQAVEATVIRDGGLVGLSVVLDRS